MNNPIEVKIFLSCPGDVIEERNELKQFIEKYSEETTKKYNISLEAKTWDEDAQRGPGRGQKLINELLDNCDIYIGLSRHRSSSFTA